MKLKKQGKIDIMGETYTIEFTHDIPMESYTNRSSDYEDVLQGLCDTENKVLYIYEDMSEREHKITARHEVIHAFLYECGLDNSTLVNPSGWALNEEMVDFFALQWSKINKIFKELDILDIQVKKEVSISEIKGISK